MMKLRNYEIKTQYKALLADTVTPVSIYLRLRDKFANTILLESSDYHGQENSLSYICCQPIATFLVEKGNLELEYPDGATENKRLDPATNLVEELSGFMSQFQTEATAHKFINNGLFGFMSYEAVQHFEDISLRDKEQNGDTTLPEMRYHLYKFVIVIDHFKNQLYVFEHSLTANHGQEDISKIIDMIFSKNIPVYNFELNGEEQSNYTDEEFLEIIGKGKHHCLVGDVFQIVLSRRFQAAFRGDELNVYRALRSINPSPYLFYFDYGNFKIFGSSPEAQITIRNGKATIYPIAGTFLRTGDDVADAELAQKLHGDEKENSEHLMLVDLARNDLSKSSRVVAVETLKEIQYYSHVIHLVSKVTGQLPDNFPILQLVADTFPAGTLSGAPKHRAMQLIDKYENTPRSYYGGAIGMIGFDGSFNHAIMIRSFLSRNNKLTYQAGAGVVAKSVIESELQEVNNKLAALRSALKMAEEIGKATD